MTKTRSETDYAMKKLDRRIARSRKALGDALVELALERGLDSIKIRDITERANVGYATFYRHYKSKNDLLTCHLREIQQEIERGIDPQKTHYEVSLLVFTVIDKYRDACLLGTILPQDHPAMKPILEATIRIVDSRFKARSETVIPLEVSANHLVNSFMRMVNWWITEGQAYSVEQMATMSAELILKATETAALDRTDGTGPSPGP